MRQLFKPALLLMSRLKYPGKFLLIGFLSALPLIVILTFLITELNSNIRAAEKEILGLSLLQPLRKVMRFAAEHGRWAQINTAEAREKTRDVAGLVDASMRTLSLQADRYKNNYDLDATSRVEGLAVKWRAARDNRDPARTVELHRFTIVDINELYEEIGNLSGLTFEANLVNFRLLDILLLRIPGNKITSFEMLSLLNQVRRRGKTSLNDRIQLSSHANKMNEYLHQINREMQTAFVRSDELKKSLEPSRRSNHIATIQFINLVLEDVVYAGSSPTTSPRYELYYRRLNASNLQLYDKIFPAVRARIEKRIASFSLRRNLFIVASALTFVLVIYLFIGFYLNVIRTVSNLDDVSRGFISGELSREVSFEYHDELSRIGASFNEVGVALLQSKTETDRILQNVDEGLFLLNEELVIGEQYSRKTIAILETPEPARVNILKLLKDRVPEAVITSTTRYLKLMFKDDVQEEFLASLNPLKEVEVHFANGSSNFDEGSAKFLNFKFSRIQQNGNVSNLMATVKDVTEQVRLARTLAESEEKNNSRMEKFFKILHVDATLLAEFIDDADNELSEIEGLLRSGNDSKTEASYRDTLKKIYRNFHSIKGNAALLNLDFFVNDVHEMETRIKEIMEQKEVGGRDFLPITLFVPTLRDRFSEIREMVNRLLEFQAGFEKGDPREILVSALRKTMERLAGELGKEASLDTANFNVEGISHAHRNHLRSILVQLLRNSLNHGLETPEERRARGKTPAGRLELSTELHAEKMVIRFKDDGRGLQIDKLREKGVKAGVWSPSQARELEAARIANIIFTSGLSTADKVDENAGRGVGMNVVKDKVNSLGGKIAVRSREGRYCEFQITLPT